MKLLQINNNSLEPAENRKVFTYTKLHRNLHKLYEWIICSIEILLLILLTKLIWIDVACSNKSSEYIVRR